MTTTTKLMPADCTLRYAQAGDREAIARLAELDSHREPTGTLLVAESEAGIVAVLPLGGGDAVADPFVRTAELVEVLRLRAAQLTSPSTNPHRVGSLMERVRTKPIYALAALLVACALPASASAAWKQPVAGPSPLNNATTQNATEPAIADVGGVPYVAWREPDGGNFEVRVRRLNAAGTAWEEPWTGASPTSGGINQDSSGGSATDQTVASIGGVPYVAWTEGDAVNSELRVSRLNAAGTAWEQVVGGASPINHANNRNALFPSLTSIGGTPYVGWSESDGTNFEIRVSRLNAAGTAWEQVVGGASPINQANNRDAFEPSLTSIGGVPYVGWQETDGTNSEIRVSRLNAAGTAWEQVVGGASPINQANNRNGERASLTEIGGVPYIAWAETDGTNYETRVSRLNAAGTAWEQVVGGLSPINQADNREAYAPSLTSIGGRPYVAWRESDGTNNEIRVSRLNAAGTAWEQLVGGASPINEANNRSADDPSLAAINGIPHVASTETDGVNQELRVSRLEPEFSAEAAVPSASGAALSADVHTYGLPYPVGFQYGTALESETSTEPVPAGADNVTVTRQVDGLSPSTDYQFRPFATAGVPAPRSLGATGTFTTLAAPSDPTGPDTAGPDLELGGKRKQKLPKVRVTATCADEPCELDATGKLKLPGGKSSGALKALKLRPASADVQAAQRAKLALRPKKRTLKVASRALDGKDKAKATIAVTATDALGNETTLKRKVTVVG